MLRTFTRLAIIVVFLLPLITSAQEVDIFPPDHYIKARFTESNGKEAVKIDVPGRKPPHLRMPAVQKAAGDVLLNNVPAYDWSFGCSATSAAMMAGYYDNTGYPGVYTGPANGGIAPMNNSTWGSVIINGETRSLCPLSATRLNLDGRSTRGHVDDYWVMSGSSDPDPYITNGWTQHAYGSCTGDFMKTNQSVYGNSDGSTTFTFFVDGGPYGELNDGDGVYGLKLFFESRGCPVTRFYNQYILGYNGLVKGFTFNDYTRMIDRGMPVLIQVAGHTMLGLGYNPTGEKVLLHDTWDYSLHEMTWGGSYAGMQHYAVSVINFPCQPAVSLDEDFTYFGFPTCWQQSFAGALTSNRWSSSVTNSAGGSVNEMKADWTEEMGTSRLISAPLNTSGAGIVNLSFKTFYDDYGPGATIKIQSSSDLINWTNETWSHASGSGDITAGTTINTTITHNLGATTYIAWVIDGDHYQFDNWFIDNVIASYPAGKQLQLNVLLEGLFNGVNMNKASNGAGFQFGGDIADQITVELHQNVIPHAIVGSPVTAYLSTSGNAAATFPASSGGLYYVVIKHRNSIETWSSVPINFMSTVMQYDFSAASDAYGGNLKFMSDKYMIYTGDVNQDGVIDTGDFTPVDNDASNYATGYLATDVNGDGTIDTGDFTSIDNNGLNYIGTAQP
jgi:hypothetical protein